MICATIAYYLAVPLLRAYQKRRKGAIKAKFDLLKKKASAKAEAKRKAEQAALEGKTMAEQGKLRLGVNIDHVATVRNARGGAYPDPLRAARAAQEAGADGITAHLREDRRHITDADIEGLQEVLNVPLNFEMAATEEMQAIALRHKPHAVCIVPEKREERTTEGGLKSHARKTGWRISLLLCAKRAAASASSSPPISARSRRRTASGQR